MKIAITGNIGSGKSTIASVLKTLGALYFDADSSAKSMYLKPQIKTIITRDIDAKIYTSQGVNWPYLKSEFFKNTALQYKIEQLIHPLVFESFENFEKQQQHKICLFESAILFETGRNTDFKTIVCVCAPEPLRIQRALQRPGSSKEQVLQINSQQMAESEKAKKSTHVLSNDDSKPILETLLQWMDHWNSQLNIN